MTAFDSHEANDVLTACALRFDGWRYQQDTGFDQKAAFDQFFRTGQWKLSAEEKLATFFMLQRGLNKWDLVYEPKHGRWWRAYRTLFFEAVHLDVPAAYRNGDWYDRWDRDYAGRLDQCIEAVRKVHDATAYDDDAKPDLG